MTGDASHNTTLKVYLPNSKENPKVFHNFFIFLQEICPGHAEFSRHGDKGYLFQDYGMTKEDAKAFCNDNHGTNLFMPKKAEELDFFLYVLLQAAGKNTNMHFMCAGTP